MRMSLERGLPVAHSHETAPASTRRPSRQESNPMRNMLAIAQKNSNPISPRRSATCSSASGAALRLLLHQHPELLHPQLDGRPPDGRAASDERQPGSAPAAALQRHDPGAVHPPGGDDALYAEEKRSGTIELLLTSPLTDFQIIMGKFLGAMGLYGVMLAVTLIDVVALFMLDPEWKQIVIANRPLPARRLLHLGGPLHLEPDENQVVAVMVTFSVFLLLWVINWIGSRRSDDGRPDRLPIHRRPSTTSERGHRHDASSTT